MAKQKIITHTDCEFTHKCTNNSCIFRLQNEFGLKYLQHNTNFEEALSKADASYASWPKFEVLVVSSGIGIACQDYIGSDNERSV